MTNLGFNRKWFTRGLARVGILILASSLTAPTAFARQVYNGGSSDFIYVQVPQLSAMQPSFYQPVVSPQDPTQMIAGEIGQLWPRTVSYSFETNGIEPYVQANMRMGFQYSYSFNFELAARNSIGKMTAIPDGWYQIQVAVIRKSRDGIEGRQFKSPYERYVTSNSFFIRLTNGSFSKRLPLLFADVRAAALQHHLYVEAIPLKEECDYQGVKVRCINTDAKGNADPFHSILEPRPDYKTYLYEMPFTPSQPGISKVREPEDLEQQDLDFMDGSLAKYIAKSQLARQSLQSNRGATARQHAAKYKLTYRDLSEPAFSPVYSNLRQILDNDQWGMMKVDSSYAPIFTALCTEVVKAQSATQPTPTLRSVQAQKFRQTNLRNQIYSCSQNPQNYIRLSRVIHVGKPVTGKVLRVAQDQESYSIVGNFMQNRSSSTDSVNSVSIKPPSFLSSFFEAIGVGGGHSVNISNSRSTAETTIISRAKTLDYNYNAFSIPTIGSQKCLEVRVLPTRERAFFNPNADTENGFYICDVKEDAKVVKVRETYLHLFDRCRDTTTMQCDELTQTVNTQLRGEPAISEYMYNNRHSIQAEQNTRLMPFEDYPGAELYFGTLAKADDMEVVVPIEYATENVPSILDLITGNYREKF